MNQSTYEERQKRNPTQEGRIYDAIARGVTNSIDASLFTGLSKKVCSAHLSRLASDGLISIVSRGNTIIYSSEQAVTPERPQLKEKDYFPDRSISDFLKRPRYYGGAWYDTGKYWTQADDTWLERLCKEDAGLERSSEALGRKPSTLAWRASDRRLALPKEWAELIRPKRTSLIREPHIQLAYPFIIKARGDAADLLEVNSIVPAYLSGREDICQDIMLALLEGAITIDELRKNKGQISTFIKSFKRDNLEAGGFAISLDTPMHDGRSWHDVLPYDTGA